MKNSSNFRYLTIPLALSLLALLIVFSNLKSSRESYYKISVENFLKFLSENHNSVDEILMKDVSIHGTIVRIERQEEKTIIYFEIQNELEIPVVLGKDHRHYADHLKIGMQIEVKGKCSLTQEGIQVKQGIII